MRNGRGCANSDPELGPETDIMDEPDKPDGCRSGPTPRDRGTLSILPGRSMWNRGFGS